MCIMSTRRFMLTRLSSSATAATSRWRPGVSLLILIIACALGCKDDHVAETVTSAFRSSVGRPYPTGDEGLTAHILLPADHNFAELRKVDLVCQGDRGRGCVGRLIVGCPTVVKLPLGVCHLVCMLEETVYYLGEVHVTPNASAFLNVLSPRRAGLLDHLDTLANRYSTTGTASFVARGSTRAEALYIGGPLRSYILPAGWWRLYLRRDDGAAPMLTGSSGVDFQLLANRTIDASRFAIDDARLPIVDAQITVDGVHVPLPILNLRAAGTLITAGPYVSGPATVSLIVSGEPEQATDLYNSGPDLGFSVAFDVRSQPVTSIALDKVTPHGLVDVPIRARCGASREPVTGIQLVRIRGLDGQETSRTVWFDQMGCGVVALVTPEAFLEMRLAADETVEYCGETWLPSAGKDAAGNILVNLQSPELGLHLGEVVVQTPALHAESDGSGGESVLVNMTPLQPVAWRDFTGPIDMMRRLGPGSVEQNGVSSLLNLGHHASGDYTLEVIAPGRGIWSREIRTHDSVGCAVALNDLGETRLIALELGTNWAGAAAFDIDLEWSMAAVFLKVLQDFGSIHVLLRTGAGWTMVDENGILSMMGWDVNRMITLIHPVAGIRYIEKPLNEGNMQKRNIGPVLTTTTFGCIEGVLNGMDGVAAGRWAIGLSSQYRRIGGVNVPCPAELPFIPVDNAGRFKLQDVKRGHYLLVPFVYDRTDGVVDIKYADRSMRTVTVEGSERIKLEPIEIQQP